MERDCLRVYQFPNRPFTTYVNGTFQGFMIQFMEMFAKKYNYCYSILSMDRTVPKKDIISFFGNESVDEGDIILGPVLVNEDRNELVDISTPLFHFKHRILYRRPQLEPDLAGFTKPFTYGVWLMIAVAFLLITVPLFVRPKLIKCFGPKRGNGYTGPLSSPADLLIWLMAFAFAQAPNWPSSTTFVKGIALMWSLTTFIVATVYRSNLKAMVTLPKVSVPFNNIEEMEKQNKIPFSTLDKTALVQFLSKKDPDSVYGKMYSKLNLVRYDTQMTRVNYIMKNNAAFLGPDIFMKGLMKTLYVKTKRCDLTVAPEGFLNLFGVVLLRKGGTPLKAQMDTFVQKLLEFGLLDHWLAESLGKAERCFVPPRSVPRPAQHRLTLADFHGVLALYAGGMLLASIVFVLEVIIGNRERLIELSITIWTKLRTS
ncbi:glutamate receptor 4-like [Oratosquilla oratoria]|uniref:glutamate receptor 4-like n=1 Tax=Oratosquilla oratoria TaxID=337810 RepID=UPI003F75882C